MNPANFLVARANWPPTPADPLFREISGLGDLYFYRAKSWVPEKFQTTFLLGANIARPAGTRPALSAIASGLGAVTAHVHTRAGLLVTPGLIVTLFQMLA